jgi:hypothetical protein
MKRVALTAIAVVLLAACETTGGYRPPPVGASEQEVEPGRLRVTYRGPSRMSEAEVRDRALLRAAELTLARGYDWFTVTDRFGEIAPPTRPRFTIGIGSSSFGRRSAVGLGGSTSFGGEGTFVATLEVVAGRGARPPGPDAYDARSVANTLGPRLPPR